MVGCWKVGTRVLGAGVLGPGMLGEWLGRRMEVVRAGVVGAGVVGTGVVGTTKKPSRAAKFECEESAATEPMDIDPLEICGIQSVSHIFPMNQGP
jgi:hypothetical protein